MTIKRTNDHILSSMTDITLLTGIKIVEIFERERTVALLYIEDAPTPTAFEIIYHGVKPQVNHTTYGIPSIGAPLLNPIPNTNQYIPV